MIVLIKLILAHFIGDFLLQPIAWVKDKEVKTGEDFDRYLTIERLLNHEKAVRKSLTTESITEMKSLFDQNLEQE